MSALGSPSGGGTMVFKGGDGTMVVKGGGSVRPRAGSGVGTMLVREAGGSAQLRAAGQPLLGGADAGGGEKPAFMRNCLGSSAASSSSSPAWQPDASEGEARAAQAGSAGGEGAAHGSSGKAPAGRGASVAAGKSSDESESGEHKCGEPRKGGTPRGGEKRSSSRFDASGMSIEDLDRELSSISSDLERDIGKVYRACLAPFKPSPARGNASWPALRQPVPRTGLPHVYVCVPSRARPALLSARREWTPPLSGRRRLGHRQVRANRADAPFRAGQEDCRARPAQLRALYGGHGAARARHWRDALRSAPLRCAAAVQGADGAERASGERAAGPGATAADPGARALRRARQHLPVQPLSVGRRDHATHASGATPVLSVS